MAEEITSCRDHTNACSMARMKLRKCQQLNYEHCAIHSITYNASNAENVHTDVHDLTFLIATKQSPKQDSRQAMTQFRHTQLWLSSI